ncbi:MAG: beta-eliminating lyase-related protein [Microthrixaceae bacterium]|nr:beta-eliminating lyase-related protein [Microthrixaceae bacterium]
MGSVICHEQAHIVTDECAAPTAIGNGLTLLGLPGEHGKLTPAGISRYLAERRDTGVHTVPVTGISVTQATEAGTRYGPDELDALSELAHSRGMTVHMDGARFVNAVAEAGSTPAELTWRAGVDVMSFGATKGGALGAEAVVVFADRARDDIERLRKRTGHLLSKQRFAAAQWVAWLADWNLARSGRSRKPDGRSPRRRPDACRHPACRTPWRPTSCTPGSARPRLPRPAASGPSSTRTRHVPPTTAASR